MKRKPKTPKPAAVRIGTEDQEPSRDYWEAEAKLAIRSIAEIGDENRQLRATVANQCQLIKELREDNDREFAAGGRYVVGKVVEAAERWYAATAKIFGDYTDMEADVERAVKAVRFFAEGAISPLAQAAVLRMGAKDANKQESETDSSGKTAANQ